jgi:uncharacterized FlaG/YvyC family protein
MHPYIRHFQEIMLEKHTERDDISLEKRYRHIDNRAYSNMSIEFDEIENFLRELEKLFQILDGCKKFLIRKSIDECYISVLKCRHRTFFRYFSSFFSLKMYMAVSQTHSVLPSCHLSALISHSISTI